MIRELTKFFGLVLFPGDLLLAQASPRPFPVLHAVVDRYCITCHTDKLRTGGLSLQSIDINNLLPVGRPPSREADCAVGGKHVAGPDDAIKRHPHKRVDFDNGNGSSQG